MNIQVKEERKHDKKTCIDGLHNGTL